MPKSSHVTLVAMLLALSGISYANDRIERKRWLQSGDRSTQLHYFLWLLNKSCDSLPKDEFIQGAHILLNDNGLIYNRFIEHFKGHVACRHSSHYRSEKSPQLYIEGLYAKDSNIYYIHVLVGKTKKGAREHTWFQAESSPWRAPSSALREQLKYALGNANSVISHGHDFLRYKYTGRQAGPDGSSDHTDELPYILQCTGALSERTTLPVDDSVLKH